jgi:hypothetical protein
MKILIFAVILVLHAANAAAAIAPPKDVQALLRPILDLRAEAESSRGGHQQGAFEQSAKLIAQLFQTKTRASDEALAVLMNFYVGESLPPDLVHQVTLRGKRMLPMLLKYRKAHVVFTRRKYPASLLLADDVREKNFNDAIESVRAGKVVGED